VLPRILTNVAALISGGLVKWFRSDIKPQRTGKQSRGHNVNGGRLTRYRQPKPWLGTVECARENGRCVCALAGFAGWMWIGVFPAYVPRDQFRCGSRSISIPLRAHPRSGCLSWKRSRFWELHQKLPWSACVAAWFRRRCSSTSSRPALRDSVLAHDVPLLMQRAPTS